jgi:hypothetical protein
MCLKWERQSPFGMSFRLNWYEEIRSGRPPGGLAPFDIDAPRFPSPFVLRKSRRFARLFRYPLATERFLGTFLKARSLQGRELCRGCS